MDGDPTALLHRLGVITDKSIDVPRASGLLLSLDYVCVVGRTTLCDIMCTTTTPSEYQEARLSPKKFSKNLNVCLPYKHSHSLEELFDAKTPMQSIKAAEARRRRNQVLTDERDEFMSKTRHDRVVKEHRERLASVKIQAAVRGYLSRPRDAAARRPPRGPHVLSPSELKDFLTDLAARLHLKPIKGLTLTGKTGKKSKHDAELRNAAAYVLQRFFYMNLMRKVARSRMHLYRLLRAVRLQWVMHRFVKRTVKRLRELRREAKMQRHAATVIQTQMRAFLARRRVRLMKRRRTRNRREEEGATIIQRSLHGRLRLFYFPDFDGFMDQLQEAVIEAELNALMFYAGDERQTELDRQAELELMYLEDLRARRAAEYAEWLRQQELERLRLQELERLARLAAEEEERRRLLEEENRRDELRRMREEDEYMRRLMEEERRLRELALMRKEDLASQRANKFWADERRRLEEEERLRRLAEEEERRRQAALRAQFAREQSERYVTKLLNDGIAKQMADADREAEERRLMALEDAASAARRAEDEELRRQRLRELEEQRRLAEERKRRAEEQVCQDIITEVVQEELRKMLTEMERARLEAEEAARRAREGNIIRAFAEKVVEEIIDAALARMTEDADERARRLAEEEARRAREREEDELRRMRLEDDLAQRERRRLKDLEDELRRMQGMEEVAEPIQAIVDDAYSLVEMANFDEAENQLQLELDRLLAMGDDVDRGLLCSVQLLLGHVKLQLAKFAEADALFQASRTTRVELYTVDSIQAAEATEALGICAKKQAKYADADVHFKAAIEVADYTARGIIAKVQADIPTADPLQLHVRLLLEQAEMMLEQGDIKGAEGNVGLAEERALYMKRFASGEYDEDEGTLESLLIDCEALRATIDKAKGNYKDAVERYRKVHDDREKLFGPTHPKVASVLGAFADIELLRCHLTQAKEFIDLAQDINGKFFGQNHPTTLTYATTRAKVECAAGEYKNALERVTDALRRRKALYPDVHPTIAECFFVAAECTRELGNTKAAQKYYEEALAIRTKLFPTAHAAVAEAKMALAVNAVARCTYLPALPLLQEAVAMYADVAAAAGIAEYPDLEVGRTELAHVHILLGQLGEARTLLKGVGQALHNVLGPRHLHVANALHVLALYKHATGAYHDANVLLTHSREVVAGIVASPHALLLRSALAACINCRGPGYYESAAAHLNDAYTAASALYDADSVPVARAIHARALLMRDLGDLSEASRLLPQALKTVKDRLGMKNALFAEVLGDVGEALRMEGKADPAALSLGQAVTLRKAHLGETHAAVGAALVSQGLLLLDQHRPEDALRLLDTEAAPLLARALGDTHPQTVYARGCVGLALNTLHALGRPAGGGGGSGPSTPRSRKASLADRVTEARRLGKKARFGRDGAHDPRGKELIDAALALFDTYPQGPFGDSHPWPLELGGWGGDGADASGPAGRRMRASEKLAFATPPAGTDTVEGAVALLRPVTR